jgi:hypothetical protein
MSRKDVLWLLLPAGVVLLAGVGIGVAVGWSHTLAAAVAVGLTLPVGLFAFWFTGWLIARHPFGGLLGMTVGVAVRTLVAVGGGVIAFLALPALKELGLGFWVWLLVAYLSGLIVDTGLLAGCVAIRPPAGGEKGKG